MLLSIAIPTFLFIIASVLILMWFCKRKRRLKLEKIQLNSYFKSNNIINNKSSNNFNQKSRNKFIDEIKMNSVYVEDNNMNYYNNNACPMVVQAAPSQKQTVPSKFGIFDRQPKITNSNMYMMNDIIKNKNNVEQLIHDNGSKLYSLSDHLHAIEFNPNLTMSLEENNWGYNFGRIYFFCFFFL